MRFDGIDLAKRRVKIDVFKAIKKDGKAVNAYELGTDDDLLAEYFSRGKLKKLSGDTYEVFSLEAVSGRGEIAHTGDFIKIDTGGNPYPVDRVFFWENHRHTGDTRYEQIPRELDAWDVGESMSEEVSFLIEEKGLTISGSAEKYFSAPLWGTVESAEKDAVIVFYSITRDAEGHITDADFNFVARGEFDKMYDRI